MTLGELFETFLEEQSRKGLYILSDRFEDTLRYLDAPTVVMRETDLAHLFYRYARCSGFQTIKPETAIKLVREAVFSIRRVCGGEVYRPDQPDERFIEDFTGNFAINVYRPYTPLAGRVDPHPCLGFYDEIMERLWAADADYVDNWMAYKLQHPEAHMFAIMQESEQGTGKSFLFDYLFAPLMGPGQYYRASKFPVGNFDKAPYFGKQLVTYQDVGGKRGASRRAYESIKPVITDGSFEVEKKFHDARMAENYCIVYISYNTDRAGGVPPIALPKDDRRIWTSERCVHRVSRSETQTFVERFLAEIARCNGGEKIYQGQQTLWHDALYERLISKKIPGDFNPILPKRSDRFYEVVGSCNEGLQDLTDRLASFSAVTLQFVQESLARGKDFSYVKEALLSAGFILRGDSKTQITIRKKRRRNVYYRPECFNGEEPKKIILEEVLNVPVVVPDDDDDDNAVFSEVGTTEIYEPPF